MPLFLFMLPQAQIKFWGVLVVLAFEEAEKANLARDFARRPGR